MNSKAIKRQLLAAIAMVLVAALALGSSTYAWFVASGTVEAKGMSVTAQGESGLLISHGGQLWGSTASAGMEAAKALFPSSTADLKNWSHATALATTAATAEDSSFINITDQVFGESGYNENNSYVVMKDFDIRSSSSTNKAKGLYVKEIDVTVGAGNPAKTMSTALRVGVQYIDEDTPDNSKFYIYAPVSLGDEPQNKPSDRYDVIKFTKDEGASTETKTTISDFAPLTTYAPTNHLLPDSFEIPSDNLGIKVNIFIWIEGEDHNLFTDNFYTEELGVTVTFSVMPDNTSSGG